jgi:uncharacterized Zn-finger protein
MQDNINAQALLYKYMQEEKIKRLMMNPTYQYENVPNSPFNMYMGNCYRQGVGSLFNLNENIHNQNYNSIYGNNFMQMGLEDQFRYESSQKVLLNPANNNMIPFLPDFKNFESNILPKNYYVNNSGVVKCKIEGEEDPQTRESVSRIPSSNKLLSDLNRNLKPHKLQKKLENKNEINISNIHEGNDQDNLKQKDQPKYYRCTFADCNKVFPKECNLRDHIRTHTGEKPFKCSFESCKKSFSQHGNLKKHEKVHYGDKKFPCSFFGCGKKFSASYNLKVRGI